MAQNTWQRRIVGHGEENPTQLLANPFNHRIHSYMQQRVMEGLLDELGWIDEIIVNRTTGHVINGHMRVALAIGRGEQSVPVQYVDLTEEQERLALATFDPVASLAGTDAHLLQQHLQSIRAHDQRVLEFIQDLAQTHSVSSAVSGLFSNLSSRSPAPVENAAALADMQSGTAANTDEVKDSPSEKFASVPHPDAKIVQLAFDPETHQQFMRAVEALFRYYAVDSVSRVVYEAVLFAYRSLAERSP